MPNQGQSDKEKGILAFALGAAIVALFMWHGSPSYEWQGWVYPYKHALVIDVPLGRFASLEECRQSARKALEYTRKADENGDAVFGDYECGYQCKPADGGLNVCKRTQR